MWKEEIPTDLFRLYYWTDHFSSQRFELPHCCRLWERQYLQSDVFCHYFPKLNSYHPLFLWVIVFFITHRHWTTSCWDLPNLHHVSQDQFLRQLCHSYWGHWKYYHHLFLLYNIYFFVIIPMLSKSHYLFHAFVIVNMYLASCLFLIQRNSYLIKCPIS